MMVVSWRLGARPAAKGCFGTLKLVESQSGKYMGSRASFACAANFSGMARRISRAAVISDDTTDEAVASTSRMRGQFIPDE